MFWILHFWAENILERPKLSSFESLMHLSGTIILMQIEINISKRVGRKITWYDTIKLSSWKSRKGLLLDNPLKLEYKKVGIAVSLDGVYITSWDISIELGLVCCFFQSWESLNESRVAFPLCLGWSVAVSLAGLALRIMRDHPFGLFLVCCCFPIDAWAGRIT
jgi:hypothetical protein